MDFWYDRSLGKIWKGRAFESVDDFEEGESAEPFHVPVLTANPSHKLVNI